MKFIKKWLKEARNGQDLTSVEYLAFTLFTVLILLFGGVVPLTQADWTSFEAERGMYGLTLIGTIVLALFAIGSGTFAYIARKGEKERAKAAATMRKAARSN